MFAIKLALAGLGQFIAHWSLGIIVIVACIVGEFAIGWITTYIPILAKATKPIQIGLLLIAVGVGLILFGEWMGAKDMAGRCDAKAEVVQSEVTKQVKRATTSPRKDKWDTDD